MSRERVRDLGQAPWPARACPPESCEGTRSQGWPQAIAQRRGSALESGAAARTLQALPAAGRTAPETTGGDPQGARGRHWRPEGPQAIAGRVPGRSPAGSVDVATGHDGDRRNGPSRVALHEAGHAVVATAVGLPVDYATARRITVRTPDGALHSPAGHVAYTRPAGELPAEPYAVMLVAGALAEMRALARTGRPVLAASTGSDHDRARYERHCPDVDLWWATTTAVALLETRRDAVDTLAALLDRTTYVTAATITAIIN